MNKLLVVATVVAINVFAWGRSVDELCDLRRKEFAFEYCGVDADDYRGSIPESKEHLVFLLEHKMDYFDVSQQLLQACRAVETSARKKKGAGLEGAVENMLRALKDVQSRADMEVGAYNVFRKWLVQTEYMISRVLEDDTSVQLPPEAIRKLLPDSLFSASNEVRLKAHRRLQAFRDLLVVESLINTYSRAHGALPDSLEEVFMGTIAQAEISTGPIHYQRQSDAWQLDACVEADVLNKCSFNVYVPLLTSSPVSGRLDVERVTLSSNFSAKRRALFKGTVLNAGTPWSCVMKKGRVARP